MNKPVLSIIAVMLVCAKAQATVSNEVLYRLGEDGAGANNIPLDSSGNNRNFAGNAGASEIKSGVGAVAGSTNYYFVAGNFYYGCTVAWPIPVDNLGVEVFVRVPAGYGWENRTEMIQIFGTGNYLSGVNIIWDGTSKGFAGFVSGTQVGTTFTGFVPGEWVALALVRDNGTTTFYANRVAQGGASSVAPPSGENGTAMHFCVNAGGNPAFAGEVDEARIFSFAQGQFAAETDLQAPQPSVLVNLAVYHLGDDGVADLGNQPIDSSGNGYDFQGLNGNQATVFTGDGATNINSQYYQMFRSPGGYYTTGLTAPADGVGVELFVRLPEGSGFETDARMLNFFGTGGTDLPGRGNGLNIVWDGVNKGFAGYLNTVQVGSTFTNVVPGQWVALALVRHRGTTAFYANRVQQGGTLGTDSVPENGGMHFFTNMGGGTCAQGEVDEARIFTLTPNAFDPATRLSAPAAPVPSDVVNLALYRMGEDGVAGSGNQPKDSTPSAKDFIYVDPPNAAATVVAHRGAVDNSSHYYRLAQNGMSVGYYDTGLPNAPADGVGVEVFLRIPAGSGLENQTATSQIFGTGVLGVGKGMNLVWDGVNKGYAAYVNDMKVGNTFTNVVPGKWVALALVRHRTFTSFYANGVRQGDGLGTGGVPDQSASMHFGVEAGAAAHFSCEADEARVFSFSPGGFNPASDLTLPVPPPPGALIMLF